MNVGIVAGYNLDRYGGMERWIEEFSLHLRARHRVAILTTDAGERSVERVRRLKKNGVSVEEIRRISGLCPSPRDFPTLLRFLEGQDVVYFVYWAGGLELATLLASRLTTVPVIAAYHLPMDPSKRGGALPDTQVYHRFFGYKAIRVARRFRVHHTLDLESADFLRSKGFRNVWCVPNGVDVGRFSPQPKFEDFTVLFVGRLEYQKGADFLPGVAEQLRQRGVRVRLLVVGGGPLEQTLSHSVGPPTLELLGSVDDQRKTELVERSHVLLMPSRWEGFPSASLEACSSGTPIIGSPVGGLREIIVEGKSGFHADTPNLICDRIEAVYRMWLQGSPYSELARRTRQTALRYDWERVTPEMEELLTRAAHP